MSIESSYLKLVQQQNAVYQRNLKAQQTEGATNQKVRATMRHDGTIKTQITRSMSNAVVNIRNKTWSERAKAETVLEVLQKFAPYLDTVQDNTSVSSALGKLVVAMEALGNNPDDDSLSAQVMTELQNIVRLNTSSSTLVETVFNDAKIETKSLVLTANNLLSKLNKLNKSMVGDQAVNYHDQRDLLLLELAQVIDFEPKYNEDGQVTIYKDGVCLLSINLGPVTIVDNSQHALVLDRLYQNNSKLFNFSIQHPQLGRSQLVDFSAGKLSAMQQLFNTDLPLIATEFNNFALQIADIVNKHQSIGSSYPAAQKVQSSQLLTLNQRIEAPTSAKTVALLVNEQGIPINIGDNDLSLPINLYFGQENIRSIIKLLNRWLNFSSQYNRAKVGPLQDIQLQLLSNQNGNLTFDLYAINQDIINAKLTIDPNSIKVVVGEREIKQEKEGILNINAIVVKAGKAVLEPVGLKINLGDDELTEPCTITMDVTVAGEGGKITGARISYIIPTLQLYDTHLIPASDVKELDAGTELGQIIARDQVVKLVPASNISYADAKLVDEQGREVTEDDKKGYLVIETRNGSRLVLVDDLLSTDNQSYFIKQGGLNDLVSLREDKYGRNVITIRDGVNIAKSHLISLPDQFLEVNKGSASLATFSFSDWASVKNIREGDNFYINGITFAFTAHPTKNTEVAIGESFNDNIQNLINAMKNHPKLSELYEFTYEALLSVLEIRTNYISLEKLTLTIDNEPMTNAFIPNIPELEIKQYPNVLKRIVINDRQNILNLAKSLRNAGISENIITKITPKVHDLQEQVTTTKIKNEIAEETWYKLAKGDPEFERLELAKTFQAQRDLYAAIMQELKLLKELSQLLNS